MGRPKLAITEALKEKEKELAQTCDSLASAMMKFTNAQLQLTASQERERKLREAIVKLKVDRTALLQKFIRLRIALRKAHGMMFSWFSSEYANHPATQEISAVLANNTEQERP